MTNTFAFTALAVWSALLTFALLACVRQIVMLGARADKALYDGQDPYDDGPTVGSEIPGNVLELFDGTLPDEGPAFLLFISTTCTICRDLLAEIVEFEPDVPFAVMVAGADENLNGLVHPSFFDRHRVITDPIASELPRTIDLSTVPFLLEIRRERLAAKAAIRGFDHLTRFIEEAEAVDDSEVQVLQLNNNKEVVVNHVIVD